jgi:hypothetical protein
MTLLAWQGDIVSGVDLDQGERLALDNLLANTSLGAASLRRSC